MQKWSDTGIFFKIAVDDTGNLAHTVLSDFGFGLFLMNPHSLLFTSERKFRQKFKLLFKWHRASFHVQHSLQLKREVNKKEIP